MPDEIRVNRSTPVMQTPAVSPTPQPQAPSASKMPWIILVVVVVLLLVLGILFRDKLFNMSGKGGNKITDKSSGYQAVFLTNGQVYFGKLANTESTYVTLTDIFYLQVIQPPLQGQQEAGQQQPQQQSQPQISLVKLGNELHGPVDEMKVNRDHILFFEDLKENGQVVQAIKNFKANPSAGADQQQQPQQ